MAVQNVVNPDDEPGKLRTLQVLIRHEANVNAVTSEGWTPVMHAAHPPLWAARAAAGANVSATANNGFTALHMAAQCDPRRSLRGADRG